ncbi:hypothetical protein AB0J43_60540 [Nonomuraea fuscirosea]
MANAESSVTVQCVGAATEGLIENALERARPGDDVDALLHETLAWHPPLKATRRLDTLTGDEVTIDLVTANREAPYSHVTFGHGVRPCPAPAHALALAAGVLEGVLG